MELAALQVQILLEMEVLDSQIVLLDRQFIMVAAAAVEQQIIMDVVEQQLPVLSHILEVILIDVGIIQLCVLTQAVGQHIALEQMATQFSKPLVMQSLLFKVHTTQELIMIM